MDPARSMPEMVGVVGLQGERRKMREGKKREKEKGNLTSSGFQVFQNLNL